jgi:hypothetical protein
MMKPDHSTNLVFADIDKGTPRVSGLSSQDLGETDIQFRDGKVGYLEHQAGRGSCSA